MRTDVGEDEPNTVGVGGLVVDRCDDVGLLAFDSVATRNALTVTSATGFVSALSAFSATSQSNDRRDGTERSVLFRRRSQRTPRIGRAAAPRLQAQVQTAVRLMAGAAKPLVAAIDGPAVGAGFGLAMMCSVRIGTPRTVFRDAALGLGLVSGHGVLHTLTQALGLDRTRAFKTSWTRPSMLRKPSRWGCSIASSRSHGPGRGPAGCPANRTIRPRRFGVDDGGDQAVRDCRPRIGS